LLEKLPPARRRALRAAVDGLADGPGAVAPLLAAVLPAP
jgi:hypothetical protein